MSCITYEVKVDSDGTKIWFLDDKLHREDGPAYEGSNGSKYWYLNGKRHREDGPAYEGSNGSKSWYLNDKRHREDGPAIESYNGTKFWYLNNVNYSEEAWKKKLRRGYRPTWATCTRYRRCSVGWRVGGEHRIPIDHPVVVSIAHPNTDPCANKIVEIEGKKYKLVSVE